YPRSPSDGLPPPPALIGVPLGLEKIIFAKDGASSSLRFCPVVHLEWNGHGLTSQPKDILYIHLLTSTGRDVMIESRQDADHPSAPECPIEVNDDAFLVDAALIGQLLHVSAAFVPMLMREGQITSVCERGIDEHDGEFRLTFFYRNRRARLSTDLA